jgi:tetratricopeptide (TPR) repeat protein
MSSGPAQTITVEHLSRAKTLANDSEENTLFVREILGRALEGAISVAPHFGTAEAWATLANAVICDHLNRWNPRNPPNLAQAENAVRQALAIDRDLPLAHFVDGFVKRAKGDHGAALMAFDQALQLKPDFARAYAQKANELINVGRPNEALPLVEKAIELNPRSPSLGMYYWIIGKAYFFAKNYGEAIKSLEKSIVLRKNLWYNRLYLISALAITGQIKQAQEALTDLNAKFGPYTLTRVASDERANPNTNEVVVAGRRSLHEGLRAAGMTA